MISFYPGPSRVYSEVPTYVADAYKQGIMSINHRSEEFVKISQRTIALLKSKLNIPRSYTIFFTSSATECWEIIAQSLISDRSYHIYNGAFGQKWFDYTRRLHPTATPLPFGIETALDPKQLLFDQQPGLICLTQNETSNGTQLSNNVIRAIKKNNSSYLIAVDATSSMAGIALDFKAADIWFASVQKCFGLPAGLGLLICSPTAIARASEQNERSHYNSLPFMIDMMSKWQTSFTPNVLSIYLLMRVLEKIDNISGINEVIEERYSNWANYLSKRKHIRHLIPNTSAHSFTVLPIYGEESLILKIKKQAKKEGILLGEGYGDLKASTFRIANFPAITTKEINKLMQFLKPY